MSAFGGTGCIGGKATGACFQDEDLRHRGIGEHLELVGHHDAGLGRQSAGDEALPDVLADVGVDRREHIVEDHHRGL